MIRRVTDGMVRCSYDAVKYPPMIHDGEAHPVRLHDVYKFCGLAY